MTRPFRLAALARRQRARARRLRQLRLVRHVQQRTTSTRPAPPARRARRRSSAPRRRSLGTFLVDAKGRALYLWDADHGAKSICSGACAQAWPPLTTTGTPKASGAAKASLLGTTTRADGSREVTYAGHPLYYFEGDSDARPDHRPGQRRLRLAVVGRLAGRQGDPELELQARAAVVLDRGLAQALAASGRSVAVTWRQ